MTVRKSTYTHRRQHALKLILDEPPSGRVAPYRDDEIARMAGISTVTVRRLRRVMVEKRVAWSDVAHLDEAEWTALLNKPAHREPLRRLPDWAVLHTQLSTSRMTIRQAWEVYQALNPSDALSYKRFAALYLRHRETRPLRRDPSHHSTGKPLPLSTAGRTLAPTTRKSP